MAQAIHAYSASDAAAEIHHLMNTRPTLPHRHEIEAIVAKVAPALASPLLCSNAVVDEHRRQWRTLMVAWDAALDHYNAVEKKLGFDCPETEAAHAAANAVLEKLGEYEEALWDHSARVPSLAGLGMSADILVNQLWPGRSLTENFNGDDEKRAAWTLEDAIESGPECCGGPCDQALGVLLCEIRDLIVRPAAPLSASASDDLLRSVRTTIAAHAAVERQNIAEGDDSDVAIARNALWKALFRAQDTIPNPPRSPLHVLLHAEIAYHAADKDADGITLSDSDDDDHLAERSAARLIEAVLAFFGRQVVIPDIAIVGSQP